MLFQPSLLNNEHRNWSFCLVVVIKKHRFPFFALVQKISYQELRFFAFDQPKTNPPSKSFFLFSQVFMQFHL